MRGSLISHRVARLLGVAALMTTAITGAVTASAAPASASGFVQVPGKAIDIGVGANDSVWVLGGNIGSSGYQIYRWNGSNWDNVPGAGASIDVDPQGNPWVVNEQGNVYHYSGSGFGQVSAPAATDVGVGANGQVWLIGKDNQPFGHSIYKRTGSGWTQVPGSAIRVDVDQNGDPWVVNINQDIYRWSISSFFQVSGKATDIGIGARGDVWITGFTQTVGAHGYPIFRWNSSGWTQVAGEAVVISSGANHNPWVVNLYADIYRWVN